MGACTEPVRTGIGAVCIGAVCIGAVCVVYGRPKWPITVLNHTHKQTPTHTNIPGTE